MRWPAGRTGGRRAFRNKAWRSVGRALLLVRGGDERPPPDRLQPAFGLDPLLGSGDGAARKPADQKGGLRRSLRQNPGKPTPTRKCRPLKPKRPRSPAKTRFGRHPASRSSAEIGTFSARHYFNTSGEFYFRAFFIKVDPVQSGTSPMSVGF